MWFAHSVIEIGIDKTNEINRAAVHSMALVELKRMKKLFGVDAVHSFDELAEFIARASALIKPRFMRYRIVVPEPNVIRWEWEPGACFAYQGIKNLGLLDEYRCGIFVRVEAWLEGLGIPYEVHPNDQRCSMQHDGQCTRDFRVSFDP
jgi:hypothetical protein